MLPAAWHGAYQPPPCDVGQCGEKGNGLLAARAIAEGEVIFTERPRVCVTLSAVPHCAHCCRSTAPPLPGLPAETLRFWPSPAKVSCPSCDEIYCSEQCAAAAVAYHQALCTGRCNPESSQPAPAVAVPVDAANDERVERVSEDDDVTVDVELCAHRNSGTRAQAAARLRAYCNGFAGGALERCAEFPLMALKLIAMAVSELRASKRSTSDALSFADALVGMAELQWGNYATAPRNLLPEGIDTDMIWALVVESIGMSKAEQAWAGGVAAIEFVLGVLCANTIRITPRSPFDIFMARVRQEGDEQKRAAVRVAVQKVVQDAHEAQSGGETAQPCAAGEMDALIRGICGVSVGAMFAVHSKINHSCDFNSEVESYHFDNSLIHVIAKRPIQRGMELTTSYVDPGLDPSVRQESLLCNHNFSCTCPRCVNSQRFDRRTGLWVTAISTRRSGGCEAIGTTSAKHLTAPSSRKTNIDTTASAAEHENHDCSSSSSGDSDMADFVDAFAAKSDDY